MKRRIFIVDDKIDDVMGFLLILYATLSDCFDKEDELKARFEEIELFYIDILWDKRLEALQSRKEFFTKSCTDVNRHVQNAGVPLFSNMEYLPVSLSEECYRDQTNRGELAEQVYNAISERQQDGSPYVILLDVILNLNMDAGKIRNREDVLSSILFREKIDEKHCIVYSSYDDYVFEDWKFLIGKAPICVRRDLACRGRAIDLEYQRGLLNALKLAENGDGQADG